MEMAIIPAFVLRNLSDKLDERRKSSAHEINGIVKQLVKSRGYDKITAVINVLINDFANFPHADYKKGGLLGLAAVTVGLAQEAAMFVEYIIPPVLNAFEDQNTSVRFYACEALYNIAKVVRVDLIVYFNQIFDALCKLSADPDTSVQSAVKILDRLVKDIVTESAQGDHQFKIEELVPLLRERMNILNSNVRRFLVGWITFLDGVPEIDMLSVLPDLLDGLFNMLSNSSPDIQEEVNSALSEFLEEVKDSPNVDYHMVEILVHMACSSDDTTCLTAVTWIYEFLKLGQEQLLHCYDDILEALLPCISHENENIRLVAYQANEELRTLCADLAESLDTRSILNIARRQLSSKSKTTRMEVLHWIATLLTTNNAEVISNLNEVFDSLLLALLDPFDEVVLLAVEIHACIARDSPQFNRLFASLVDIFRSDRALLQKRGVLVICRLCVLLEAERVYRKFSMMLEREGDLEFASVMVQALNLVLLTSSELAELRTLLKQVLVNASANDLFLYLYSSWCHSPVATVSICLLAQEYQLADGIIQSLEEEDMNLNLFVQLDKLVRLLETPIFAYLRLQLLHPERYTWLLKSLYGLLMLLPQQSAAFKILWARLQILPLHIFGHNQFRRASCGNPYTQNSHIAEGSSNNGEGMHDEIDTFARMLQQFSNMQNQHRQRASP